jgi:CRP-like cAMP-binding protein
MQSQNRRLGQSMRSDKKHAPTTLRDLAGVAKSLQNVDGRRAICSQGDIGKTVMYIQKGGVKLSVSSKTCKEAVVAIPEPGDFFGETCLTGRFVRNATATTTTTSTILVVRKNEILRLLRTNHSFCGVFTSYLLARNLRVEEDLSITFVTAARGDSLVLFFCSQGMGINTRPTGLAKYRKRRWQG